MHEAEIQILCCFFFSCWLKHNHLLPLGIIVVITMHAKQTNFIRNWALARQSVYTFRVFRHQKIQFIIYRIVNSWKHFFLNVWRISKSFWLTVICFSWCPSSALQNLCPSESALQTGQSGILYSPTTTTIIATKPAVESTFILTNKQAFGAPPRREIRQRYALGIENNSSKKTKKCTWSFVMLTDTGNRFHRR